MWAGQDSNYHPEPSERHAPQQQTRLELASLDTVVQGYFEAGLAPSTRRTYQSGINRFYKFCTTYQIPTPLPVTQSTLCYFISALARDRLAYSTIYQQYGICISSIIYQNPDPSQCQNYPSWSEVSVNLPTIALHAFRLALISCIRSGHCGHHQPTNEKRLCYGRFVPPASSGSSA